MNTLFKRSYIVFFLSLFIISVICGVIYARLNIDISLVDKNFIENINLVNLESVLISIGIISLSILFSFFGIGIIMFLFYICYEWFITGFIITIFVSNYSFKGLFVGILFYLIYKAVLILFIYLFTILLSKNFKQILGKLIIKKDININLFLKNIKKIIIIFIIFILINLLLLLFNSFFSNIIFNIIAG